MDAFDRARHEETMAAHARRGRARMRRLQISLTPQELCLYRAGRAMFLANICHEAGDTEGYERLRRYVARQLAMVATKESC